MWFEFKFVFEFKLCLFELGIEKEKGEWAGLLGRGEKEKGKLGWVDAETKEVWAGLFSGLGWIAKGFGFPCSILFPNSNQTNTIRIQIQI